MPNGRVKPPIGYYTATVARQKLGNISDGKFRMFIEQGKIIRYVPLGSKQGFYTKKSVDALAREINGLPISKAERTGTRFRRATREDMPACVDLLIKIFGGENTTERRQSWIDKNPEVAHVVESKGNLVACAFVLPLLPEKIEAIFADQNQASMRQILAADVQPLVPGEDTYLYVVSVGVLPGSQLAKRIRGEILVRGLINQLIEWGRRGIKIKLIAGRSDMIDGVRLMIHMGFTEIESQTAHRNFIIEVEKSGIPHILDYKSAYAESQKP